MSTLLACAAGMPPLPLAMYVAPDVPAEDAEAYREAAAQRNEALAVAAIHEVDAPPGCGLVVVRGAVHSGQAGFTRMVSSCRLHTYLRPGMDAERRIITALHELGHALLAEQQSMAASMHEHTDESIDAGKAIGFMESVMLLDRLLERLDK